MDQRLEKALDFANYATTLQNQKEILLKQFTEDSYFYYNGSAFLVTPELISFCKFMQDLHKPTIILLDVNKTPVQIDELDTFIENIVDQYVQTTNIYLKNYQTFRNNRTVKGLVDL